MESVEESISALRLKIEETKKIRRRQETELFELTIVLADIHKKAREANRDCFERIQAAEQQKTKQRLEAAIRQETKQRQEAARKQKKVAKERHRRLLLDTVQKEERNKIRLRTEERLAQLRLEFLKKEEEEDSIAWVRI
jgi:hypothetical protein